jgi:hypothetical protein
MLGADGAVRAQGPEAEHVLGDGGVPRLEDDDVLSRDLREHSGHTFRSHLGNAEIADVSRGLGHSRDDKRITSIVGEGRNFLVSGSTSSMLKSQEVPPFTSTHRRTISLGGTS